MTRWLNRGDLFRYPRLRAHFPRSEGAIAAEQLGLLPGGKEDDLTRVLVADHSPPLRYVEAELLALDDTSPSNVEATLKRLAHIAVITAAEHKLLADRDLQSTMPVGWTHWTSRYVAAGITIRGANKL
jgi:hypothetical protein